MDAPASCRDLPRRAQTALGISMLEGALHALMVGVAESYLGAFAVELGHRSRELAMLSTLPLLAGASVQLLAPFACAVLGSRKRLAVAGALGQTVSLAALFVIAVTQSTSFGALLVAQLGLWTSGGAMAPAWNAWMASLTRHTQRSRYFARRSAINQLALLVAFGGAGLALHHAGTGVLRCFVILFFVAFTARLASVVALLAQADLDPVPRLCVSEVRVVRRAERAWRGSSFQVPLYLCALAFGTHLAAPFFTPYMLRELGLDYRMFAALSATSILAKAITLSCCHHLGERFGLQRLLRWGGAGVALTPVIWAGSSQLGVLVFAHLLGGAVWAVVEYASYQLLLDAAPGELTAEYFSISNCMTGLAQVAGALCGAFLLGRPSMSHAQLFIASAALRALPLAVFAARGPRLPLLRELYLRLAALRTSAMTRPILVATELPRSLGNRTTEPPPAL